jgi:hypothetical protein
MRAAMTLLPVKLVVAAFGIAVLLATPADAQKARKDRTQAAAKPATTATASQLPSGPNTVWFGNEYLGADPDPRIRHELMRDLSSHFGGNF